MDQAEQLIGEARERREREPDARERRYVWVSSLLFVAAATAIAVLIPANRDFDPLLAGGLVLAYAIFLRVQFEYGDAYVSAEQLAYVPMVLLLPLPVVPILAATAGCLAVVPELVTGKLPRQRLLTPIGQSWFSIGPVLVIAWLAPGAPSLDHAPVYVLAFAAEVLFDHGSSVGVNVRWLGLAQMKEAIRASVDIIKVDAILSPVAFVITLVAYDQPLVLVVMAPLVWLLRVFSRDRQERYTATLELNRAYRGTVMLLADVVEFEDGYTADHSRSVVELVQAVAKELDVEPSARQEMEFAALLHDVGKITIDKAILNKPAKLSDAEFEVMKTHTIEGQFMLDRVGGLLGRVGEIVRSCHERWDGKGYPDGLAGEEIPLTARIVFVCDAYNAMTTDRPYREALSTDDALAELVRNAGTQFDPAVVAALMRALECGRPQDVAPDEMRALLAGVRRAGDVAAA
jgi:HD-GYP domain-containing protein (c-di-GMP phosphodiesterase class II)